MRRGCTAFCQCKRMGKNQSIRLSALICKSSSYDERRQCPNQKNLNWLTQKLKKTVARLKSVTPTGKYGKMESTYRLDFSGFEEPGEYYIKAGKAVSPTFPINTSVYDGTADFVLNYMRQQQLRLQSFPKSKLPPA